jgi:hypothetical protein
MSHISGKITTFEVRIAILMARPLTNETTIKLIIAPSNLSDLVPSTQPAKLK